MDGSRELQAMLDAWRECGADRIEPVRFHYIEALRRRASRFEGEARRLLDDRIAALVGDYAGIVGQAARDAGAPDSTHAHRPTLAPLLDLLMARAQAHAAPPPPGQASMGALASARRTWTEVRTQSQLRRSLEQTAEDAGPLNSARLVHRALRVMGTCSPAYLEQFVAYLDALSWLEQMDLHGALATGIPATAPGATAPARRPRKPRKPRPAPTPANDAG